MFNHGITELMRHLPDFEGLDGAMARRLLSYAYAETLDLRAGEYAGDAEMAANLGRLSTALQLHAILAPGIEPDTRRACAFVAAEALSLIDEIVEIETAPAVYTTTLGHIRYRRLESGLLYLMAGYDSSAAVMASGLEVREPLIDPSHSGRHVMAALEAAVAALRGILLLHPQESPKLPDADDDAPVEDLLRAELWHRLGNAATAHLSWLRLEEEGLASPAPPALDELLKPLLDEQAGAYADIAHLARLLREVVQETDHRALRRVPPPDPLGSWNEYRAVRSRARPLLWPAAADYARECLPGPQRHAAVAVPTGAGKSGVAELAVAQAVSHGWVLYLAPTNALVAQVQRDLRGALRSLAGIEVRGFVGGAELVEAAEETFGEVESKQVLVMTPEKCSLALRQSPEVFATLALCVLDECHLIADRGTRGVLAELVVAHVLFLAPEARVLLLSALMANPNDLAAWLQTATGQQAIAVREPWRPTRTLRAVLGFDAQRSQGPADEAAEFLRTHPRRRNRKFEAPVSLLAGLQGAWEATDRQDYALVPTAVSLSLAVTRDEEVEMEDEDPFSLNSSGYVNVAVAVLADTLARQGHHVLAFLPRNRHYSFSVGSKIDLGDLPRAPLPEDALAQLALADAELGLPTAVRELLEKGVAVHTSAMLSAERRACEISFDRGSVRVMLATGTLAQGLNLPATAVIIGGTEIGHDTTLTQAQRDERTRAQLLNAIGRSGRPGVAARSLAVVVPNRAVTFGDDWTPDHARDAAPFLAYEDAAAPVTSQLDVLVDRALRGDFEVEGMSTEELAAFAVLPLDAEGTQPSEIVRRSYGAWRRNADSEGSAQVIARSLVGLGQRFLGDRPRWPADAAYRAGLTVLQTLALHDAYLAIRPDIPPDTPQDWVTLTVAAAAQMPLPQLTGIVDAEAISSTRLTTIHDSEADAGPDGWTALHELASAWMEGKTYEQLAVLTVGPETAGRPERHQQAALPRVIRVVDQVFVFGLSRLAGGLVALHQVGAEVDAHIWALNESRARSLGLAPLAIRSGCGPMAALAWYRFAVRQRHLAHLFGSLLPPADIADDVTAREEVRRSYERWLDEDSDEDLILAERSLAALRAWRLLHSDE